jgi:hypothetical protein
LRFSQGSGYNRDFRRPHGLCEAALPLAQSRNTGGRSTERLKLSAVDLLHSGDTGETYVITSIPVCGGYVACSSGAIAVIQQDYPDHYRKLEGFPVQKKGHRVDKPGTLLMWYDKRNSFPLTAEKS